jgi:hypothetical protein
MACASSNTFPYFSIMHRTRFILLLLTTWLIGGTVYTQSRFKEIRRNYEQKAIPHFTYYFQKNSLADSAQYFIDSTLPQYRKDVLELMGEPTYPPRMEIFFFNTPADYAYALHHKKHGASLAVDQIACVIFSSIYQGYSRHEITHIISINLWGPSALWMEEGLAALSDESFQDADFHVQAKELLASDNFIEPKTLMKKFEKYDGEWRRYVEAASLLSFIRAQYGVKTLQSCWIAKTVAQPGITEEQVLEAWMAFLKK